jgi:glycosyltransferase involved in cell wall biosynthesis
MNVAYCSLLLPEEKKLVERAKEHLSGISLHKYTRAVIEGIDANSDKPVSVFNIINTLNFPKFPQIVFETEEWSHVKESNDIHIGYINIIGVKYITQALILYRKLSKWLKDKQNKQNIICVHHIYFPMMVAARMVKKKYGDSVVLCLITGDMNGRYGLQSQYKRNVKGFFLKYVEKSIDSLAQKFDCYVFATKYMADGFNVAEKPFVVMECAYTMPEYSGEKLESINRLDGKKILFYAGALREEYGILHLLRSFSLIRNPNYRLWLAGGGALENQIKEYIKKDNRIEFLGFITPKEVDKRQKQATVLISPRTNQYEFVKYSFPSKTMECLASGKPYIAHKLLCDPPEYENYIQYADDESDEALCKKIIEVCELSDQEIRAIGVKAQEFIKRDKNPHVMCNKVIQMWKKQCELK